MCGIFGLVTQKDSSLGSDDIKSITSDLLKLSQSRGKDASGLALLFQNKIEVLKQSNSATALIRSKEYKALFDSLDQNGQPRALSLIGHARMVTNGSRVYEDNQPVVRDGLVGIHNGIIVNADQLWRKFKLKRKFVVDTEIVLALIRNFLEKGQPLKEALQKTFKLTEGAASMGIFFQDFPYLFLFTNTGSLYYCYDQKQGLFLFTSEEYFLQELVKRHSLSSGQKINQLLPGETIVIDVFSLRLKRFRLMGKEKKPDLSRQAHFEIAHTFRRKKEPKEESQIIEGIADIHLPQLPKTVTSAYDRASEMVDSLRRCTKCILPETMPFIEFDEKGVCNYCRNYRKHKLKGKKPLVQLIKKSSSGKKRADCIVAFSGGKDSSYALHYLKRVLDLNPIAYSYDWGMLTDLGRRNQSRMCGKLGIEHILISANIQKKRENIRKNMLAWLRQPDLGTVPLLMAGDKQFFYYANQLVKQTGIKTLIFCGNPLEKTNFKSGFCGIKPKRLKEIYSLSATGKLKISLYYLNQFLCNPAYINSSIPDTFFAYLSYYLLPHDFLRIYKFIRWDEGKIEKTLIDKYGWETAKDTRTTWRIGDGTAAIYNYIYFMGAGFTENDTFRSNQIREGQIDRKKALRLVKAENEPRFESIKWYCDIIGVDFLKTLKTVNSMPSLFK